jgi:hypothetical protein
MLWQRTRGNDTRMTRRYTHIGLKHLASAISQLEKSHGEVSINFSTVKRKGATGVR